MGKSVNVGILTISDRSARGEYEDRSGPLIVDKIRSQTPWEISHQEVVSDDASEIRDTIMAWCDQGLSLVLTTGGTGFAPRDITPEVTRELIKREAPGIAEVLRSESYKITRHAMLSRGVAGIRGETLIINLPGNPKAVKENLDVLLPVLPHALGLLRNLPGTEHTHRSV